MFGLENKKKKPSQEFVFELEKEIKDPQKYKELNQRIEGRIQKIKEILRSGGNDQEEYSQFSVLLHGYHAISKVMSRVLRKPKT